MKNITTISLIFLFIMIFSATTLHASARVKLTYKSYGYLLETLKEKMMLEGISDAHIAEYEVTLPRGGVVIVDISSKDEQEANAKWFKASVKLGGNVIAEVQGKDKTPVFDESQGLWRGKLFIAINRVINSPLTVHVFDSKQGLGLDYTVGR